MYEQFYGLTERPFDITPNPRFLFMTAAHRDVLATIQYAIAGRKGLTLVLGPPGTGKTTLVHAALAQQQGSNVRTVYLSNPTLTREEFFEFMAQELGLTPQAATSKAAFLRELRADLIRQRAAGTYTALIIDEAQAMSDAMLEEVRLLENLETPTEKLMSVVLVSQPEMAARLRQPLLLPLRQRIALRSSLAPLTRAEVAAYIAERIRIAGGEALQVFTPEAMAAVCDACGGVPRNISVVCDNALVTGFALDERPVGAAVIAEVCRDFDLPARRDGAAAAPAMAGHGVLPAAAASPTAAAPAWQAPAAAVPAWAAPAPVTPVPAWAAPAPVTPVPAPPAAVAAAPTPQTGLTVRERAPQRSRLTNLQLSDLPPAVESLMMDNSAARDHLHGGHTGPLHALTAPVRGLRALFGWGAR